MKIVVDTNIFVGACLGAGASNTVVAACIRGEYTPLMGTTLLNEYEDVLNRSDLFARLPLTTAEREELLDIFLAGYQWTRIYYAWRPNLRDEGDNHLIELAVAGNAPWIVTRNVRDLRGMELKFPAIGVVTPEQRGRPPRSRPPLIRQRGWAPIPALSNADIEGLLGEEEAERVSGVDRPIDLPDINVWLALGLTDHPHHERALAYWDQVLVEWAAFCRITALGMVRLLTSSTVMGGELLAPGDAWDSYRRFAALPEVDFVAEPTGVEERLADLVAADAVTPRLWTDAYLAAFALAGELRVVSFDSDFRRFDGPEWYRP